MRQGLWMAAMVLGCAWMTGCESKDDAKLAKAQQCLDQASPSTVGSCTDMISGIESQKAYLIRCGALYVENGFVGDRIAQAFERIKSNSSGGIDPMATAFRIMTFTTMADANLAKTYCTASGVRSMERLATITGMATFITTSATATFPGGIPAEGASEAQITAAVNEVLAGVNAGTIPAETLGQLVVTAESSYCAEGSAFETNKVCTELGTAIANGSGNTTEIAKQLLALLQTN